MIDIASPFTVPQIVSNDLDDDVDYLIDMPSPEFRQFVLDNLGPDAPERVWRALLDDDLVIRTRNTLSPELTQACDELTNRKPASDSPDDMATFTAWRTALIEWQTVAVVRQRAILQAVKDRGHRVQATRDPKGFAHNMRALVEALACGIDRHRRACIAADVEPEAHDEALWSLLDDLTQPAPWPGAVEMSLSTLVLTGRWGPPNARKKGIKIKQAEGATTT